MSNARVITAPIAMGVMALLLKLTAWPEMNAVVFVPAATLVLYVFLAVDDALGRGRRQRDETPTSKQAKPPRGSRYHGDDLCSCDQPKPCCEQGRIAAPFPCPWHPEHAEEPDESVELVRDLPPRDAKPIVPHIDREDVHRLHGVYCYRGKERSRYDYASAREFDPWSGTCICHHATWHSCPKPSAGERIFNALPSRGVRTVA